MMMPIAKVIGFATSCGSQHRGGLVDLLAVPKLLGHDPERVLDHHHRRRPPSLPMPIAKPASDIRLADNADLPHADERE